MKRTDEQSGQLWGGWAIPSSSAAEAKAHQMEGVRLLCAFLELGIVVADPALGLLSTRATLLARLLPSSELAHVSTSSGQRAKAQNNKQPEGPCGHFQGCGGAKRKRLFVRNFGPGFGRSFCSLSGQSRGCCVTFPRRAAVLLATSFGCSSHSSCDLYSPSHHRCSSCAVCEAAASTVSAAAAFAHCRATLSWPFRPS